jgi:hypothetical protein
MTWNVSTCCCPNPESTGLESIRLSWCPIHGPQMRREQKAKREHMAKLHVIEGGKCDGEAA